MKTSIKQASAPLAVLLAALVLAVLAVTAGRAEPPSVAPAATNSVAADAPKPVVKSSKLTGAELYSIHCNRCHAERYPTERTAAQWKTIMLHMQIRANIPGGQARQILKYLQDNSGR